MIRRLPHSRDFRPTKPAARVHAGIRRLSTVVCNAKQYVPGDSSGLSPEKKCANQLRNLFTFLAARIIIAQLEGSGRGKAGAYNAKQYDDLTTFLNDTPIRDGDAWLSQLMRKNSSVALRVMEVREAYAREDFEYHNLEKLIVKDMQESNMKLMREAAMSSFMAPDSVDEDSTPLPPASESPEGQQQ